MEDGPRTRAGKKPPPPSRRLNLPSRLRGGVRRALDRALGADYVWSGLLVGVITLTLGGQHCTGASGKLHVGQVAQSDIKAPVDFYNVDGALTEERRREARERALDVYVHDPGRGVRLAGQLGALFTDGRRILGESAVAAEDASAADPREALAGRAPAGVLDILVQSRFDPGLEREVKAALIQVMDSMISGNKSLLERETEITLNRLPDEWIQRFTEFGQVVDLADARRAVRERVAQRLLLGAADERVLGEFVASFVDSNLQLDAETTQRRRESAAEGVPLVLVPVKRGDVLVKAGEPITEQTLQSLTNARSTSSGRLALPAVAFIGGMLAFFMFRYSRYHQRRFRKIKHLHALMVLLTASMLLMSQALMALAGLTVDKLAPPFNHLPLYIYLMPLGAGSILVALLANGRIALVYSSFVAILFGATHHWDAYAMVWAILVQSAGVYAISTYRERAALLRAGLVVGGAGAVSAIALEILRGSIESWSVPLYGSALAFLGGAIGVGLLISFSLPPLEALFNVLTDIRLLELSNINTPLLSELAVKAPGSYNHSLVVGTLAEEGAKAIGASPLFCRVAAFYHDIGKINKPEYYVENQRGTNPHDKLTPSMSALIIAAHVKDGIKLAREARLPEQIIDIIPQHHGTKLMTYFYERAKMNADPSMSPIKKEDFRYPGPKPQTREAAIFMLADSVEAAARTIDEPTPNRLREVIRKVSNSIVLDRQLDSCELTFADLERIQDAFLRLLVGMYHQRVDYPGFDFNKTPKGEPGPVDEISERKALRGS